MAKLNRGIEIERKYIIMKPSVSDMSGYPDYSVSEIEQIYLSSPEGITHRVRRRSFGDVTRYYETRKTRIDKMSVIEDEGEISPEEYARLKENIDVATRPLHKTRHTFRYGEQVFEVDIYPEWSSTAIMEAELQARDTELLFPPFIKVLREVTGIKGYSNAAMSRDFPSEDKPQ